MAMKLSNEQLEQATAAFAETGSNTKAGLKLGIGERDMRYRLQAARARGIGSTLYGPDGEVKLQWVKNDNQLNPIEVIEEMEKACAKIKPPKYVIEAPRDVVERLSLYVVSDLHFGMYGWGQEVETNWDLGIAEKKLNAAYDRLVAATPNTRYAVILGGGDAIHCDTNDSETSRGHNHLDVDGRHGKVFDYVTRFFVRLGDKALLKHERVDLRILRGNHDDITALMLAYFLKAWYRNEPRMGVSVDPSLFWFMKYNRVMLGATHGHECKASQMPAVMATRRPKVWGSTDHRFAHTFHLHRGDKLVSDVGGAQVEIHPVAIPNDAWSYGKGYIAGRRIATIVYDPKMGEVERHTVSL